MAKVWDLTDTYCLVTGGSRGIGRAIALDLAAWGAVVAVNYVHHESAANSVVEDIIENGGKAFAVKADTSDKSQVNSMFETVKNEFGRLDVLGEVEGPRDWSKTHSGGPRRLSREDVAGL